MPSSVYDVIVIGAGIMGSATAYTSAKSGKKTLLLEQFKIPHTRGSSHGRSRGIRRTYPQKHYAQMVPEAFELWKELENKSRRKILRRVEILSFGLKDDAFVKGSLEVAATCNSKIRQLTKEEMSSKYPNFKLSDNSIAIIEEDAGLLDPEAALQAYLTLFKSSGGVLKDGAEVTHVEPGEIVKVTTSQGDEFRARHLVLTIGSWVKTFLGPLGLNLQFKLLRVKVCFWSIKKDINNQSWNLENNPVFFCSSYEHSDKEFTGIYGIPSYDYPGMVKVCYHGGDPMVTPNMRDESVTDNDIQIIKKFVKTCLPSLCEEPSIVEPCIYTITPDEDFIIDNHPKWTNIVLGVGFSGHAFKFAPVVGKLLLQKVTEEPSTYNLEPFSIKRFKNKSKL